MVDMSKLRRRRPGRRIQNLPAAPTETARSARRTAGGPPSVEPATAVLAGYRLLRRLAAGDRADVFLAVVDRAGAERAGTPVGDASTDGPPLVVMRVYPPGADDEAITTEIEAMEGDGTGTLPRLIDVANDADGRGCLVVERISGRPLSELLAAGGMAPGQVVTALAPIVVALGGLAERGLVHTRLAASDVLIDETGRPRLLGLGALSRLDRRESAADRIGAARAAHAALLRLLEDAAAASTDRAAFGALLELTRVALEARPFRRIEGEIERALFAAAPARAILAAADRPTRGTMPGAVAGAVRGDAVMGAEPTPPMATPRETGLRSLAALAQLPPASVDDLAAALDADPRVRVLRRASAWARPRRPALLTGGFVGAAALVALLSAVPPSTADDRGGSEPIVEHHARDAAPHGSEPGEARVPDRTAPGEQHRADGAPTPSDDPVAAAAELLEIRETCLAAEDVDCVLAVDQPGSPIALRDREAIERGDVADIRGWDLDGITVAADLGDAVVLSVPWTEAGREPASLLMMRSEAGWRLREWFD